MNNALDIATLASLHLTAELKELSVGGYVGVLSNEHCSGGSVHVFLLLMLLTKPNFFNAHLEFLIYQTPLLVL
ncbi:hypothetical protein Y032_0018g3616 [Ancylostoma ceylanicum]|uniref:Uncharacterized protein n=1 Tax=Ancylostoma ceylanicum TaxID=53326 RepID=A0A016V3U5_9BILA|nr:hypothetical protein Y032_0018g3616 [Ancylostoma ceylanicum]